MQVLFPLRKKVENTLPSNLQRLAALMDHNYNSKQNKASELGQLLLLKRFQCYNMSYEVKVIYPFRIPHPNPIGYHSRNTEYFGICRCPLPLWPLHHCTCRYWRSRGIVDWLINFIRSPWTKERCRTSLRDLCWTRRQVCAKSSQTNIMSKFVIVARSLRLPVAQKARVSSICLKPTTFMAFRAFSADHGHGHGDHHDDHHDAHHDNDVSIIDS